MLRKLMLVAAPLAIPAMLAAQDIPNSHASDTAQSKVAQHRATQFRGSVVGLDNRPVTRATPAVPATRATPATPGSAGAASAASPATRAVPAVPASPSKKPLSPGQSGSHRP